MRRQLRLLILLLILPTSMWAESNFHKTTPTKRHSIVEQALFKARHATRGDVKKGTVTNLRFERLTDMRTARAGHQLFPSGKEFVAVGGHTTNFRLEKSAELFQDGGWQDINIGSAHDNGFSVMLGDGRVMVGGGSSADQGVGQSKATDIYDPATQTFTAGPSLSVARAMCKAVNVNGKVYVSGNWYADDNVLDYYDGSVFRSVGDMEGRSNPYLFFDEQGLVYAMSPADTKGNPSEMYTYNDGEKGLFSDQYNPMDGVTKLSGTVFDETRMPLALPNDIRSSDYYLDLGNINLFFILAHQPQNDAEPFRLLMFVAEQNETYGFSDFRLPAVHPDTKERIDYRGGVYVNKSRKDVYLIGTSGKANNQTLHIICINYETNAWSIASASGFNHDMKTASWALLPDGRLVCTGGIVDNNSQPSREAYAFTLPLAGEQSSQDTPATYGGPTLLVLTKDGAQTAYALSEKPQVRFEGKNLHIVSTRVDITYALSDIVRFTYADLDPSGIDEIGEIQTEIGYQDGTLTISQMKAGATVTVYGIDGKQVRQLKATRSGTYRLNLSALPQGVYIIKADTISYKIMKR